MKKEKKQLYEGMFILTSTLSDESRKKAWDKIINEITGRGGEIRKVFDQGRKKLSYAIQGKKEGYYFLLYFSAPTQVLTELVKEYKLHEDLLRYMTVQADDVREDLNFPPIKLQ